MDYFIEYPEDWIGVPPFGDGEVFATPEAWADALAAELTSGLGMFGRRKERRAGIASACAFIAVELEKGGADTGYIWLETIDGPPWFVAVRGLARADIGDATAADLAGTDGDGDFVPPIVRAVTAASGDVGVAVERHAPLDDDAVHVAVVSGTYAFEHPEGVVLLQTATTDLAGFERFRPHFEELAQTFRWASS